MAEDIGQDILKRRESTAALWQEATTLLYRGRDRAAKAVTSVQRSMAQAVSGIRGARPPSWPVPKGHAGQTVRRSCETLAITTADPALGVDEVATVDRRSEGGYVGPNAMNLQPQ